MQGNSVPSTYKFKSVSTGRVFTARHLLPLEVTAVRAEAQKATTAQGKPYKEMLCAVLVARCLIEPKLSVSEALELQHETPDYYADIVLGVGSNAIEDVNRVIALRSQQLANRAKNQAKGGKRR